MSSNKFWVQVLLPIMRAARELGASKGCPLRKCRDKSRITQSQTCGIEARSFNIKWRKRITTFRHVRPTLRWRTVFLRNENRRLQGAKANWRQPLPQLQAQPQERKARIGSLEARLAAWGADAPGQRGVPSSRRGPPDAPVHGSEDGATTLSHHERLIAGGAAAPTISQPIFTGERRRVNTHTSLANLERPHFPHSENSPSRSPDSEEVSVSNEVDLDFLEFDVTTWVPRIWNGGILGILFEIRSACDYWHRGDAHTQIAFDISGFVDARRGYIGNP
ncbi:helicase-like protein, partial [Trypanosoma cruzi]